MSLCVPCKGCSRGGETQTVTVELHKCVLDRCMFINMVPA
jgi:hypothetical protein